MHAPDVDYPRRGYVYLASVPFAARSGSLQATDSKAEPEAGFVAEIQFKLRPVLMVQNETDHVAGRL